MTSLGSPDTWNYFYLLFIYIGSVTDHMARMQNDAHCQKKIQKVVDGPPKIFKGGGDLLDGHGLLLITWSFFIQSY